MDWFFTQWGQLWSIINISSVFNKEGKKRHHERTSLLLLETSWPHWIQWLVTTPWFTHVKGKLMIKNDILINNNILNHPTAALGGAQNVKVALPLPSVFARQKCNRQMCLDFGRLHRLGDTDMSPGASKRRTLPIESTCSEQLPVSPESGALAHTRPLHLSPKSHEIVLDYHCLLTPGQQSGSEERFSSALMHVLWVGRKKMRLRTITERIWLQVSFWALSPVLTQRLLADANAYGKGQGQFRVQSRAHFDVIVTNGSATANDFFFSRTVFC